MILEEFEKIDKDLDTFKYLRVRENNDYTHNVNSIIYYKDELILFPDAHQYKDIISVKNFLKFIKLYPNIQILYKPKYYSLKGRLPIVSIETEEFPFEKDLILEI